MMGGTRNNVVLLNLVVSVVVLVVFGFWISYWDVARVILPDWVRILLVTGLFTHLIVRTMQGFRFQGVEEFKEDVEGIVK
jgi:hypothetical protein